MFGHKRRNHLLTQAGELVGVVIKIAVTFDGKTSASSSLSETPSSE